MGRPSSKRELGVWLNGVRVGTWTIASKGIHEFAYADACLNHPRARPISLSLPLADHGYSYRGEIVSSCSVRKRLPEIAKPLLQRRYCSGSWRRPMVTPRTTRCSSSEAGDSG